MEECLDGAQRYAVMVGDPLIAPAVLLAQLEHLAVAGQVGSSAIGEVRAVDRVVEAAEVSVDMTGVDVGDRLAATTPAVRVDAQPAAMTVIQG